MIMSTSISTAGSHTEAAVSSSGKSKFFTRLVQAMMKAREAQAKNLLRAHVNAMPEHVRKDLGYPTID